MVLGLVQGFAEFLPISSSGHLVVIGHLLGIKDSNIAFDVFLHFATLLAILIYFKKDILSIKLNEIKAIIIGSIPATLVGLLFKDQFEALFGSVLIVSVFLIITGFLNLMTDSKLNKLNDSVVIKKEVGIKEALIIGIFQAFAILPGISRSGSTVAGGVLQNIDREKAFRFSFLMVIPVVFGASAIQLLSIMKDGELSISILPFIVGGLTAFGSGYLSLKIFSYIIKKARLEVFGYYCIVFGLLSLFLVVI